MAAKKLTRRRRPNLMPNKNKIPPTKQCQAKKKIVVRKSQNQDKMKEKMTNERIKKHMRRSAAKCVDNFRRLNLMDMIGAFHYLHHAIALPNDNNHCNMCNFTDTLSSFNLSQAIFLPFVDRLLARNLYDMTIVM